MRWRLVWLCALSLVGSLGCPRSFGRGGTIDQAAHKDVKQMLETPECTRQDWELYCGDDSDSEECRQTCG